MKGQKRHKTPPQTHHPYTCCCLSHINQELCCSHWLSCKKKKKHRWPLAPCKRQGSKINLQCPLCHTGGSQAWLCPAAAMPGPELTPSAVQGLQMFKAQGHPPSPDVTLTLLRRRPPPWCSGVLVSDALLVFSLLLLGSLSLMMSYWRQKRAITPRKTSRSSQRPGTDFLPCLPFPLQGLLPSPDGLCAAAASLQPLAPFPIYPGMSHPFLCCWAGPPTAQI